MTIRQKRNEFRTFTKNVRETGAIFALPPHIVDEITAIIANQYDNRPLRIIELGAWPGNITTALCKNFPTADIIAYEINADFCNILRNKLHEYNNISIRQQSAEDIITDYNNDTVDVFISTLPLSTMWIVGNIILKACHEKLVEDGMFITAQYRTTQNQKIEHYIWPQVTFKKKWTFFPPVKVKISSFEKTWQTKNTNMH